ncbi:MAG: hypothetical protein AAB877_01255 [Patescibacteria group bacterium]
MTSRERYLEFLAWVKLPEHNNGKGFDLDFIRGCEKHFHALESRGVFDDGPKNEDIN